MTYQWADCRYAGAMKAGYEDREIPEALADREPVPDDIFCFSRVDLWRDRIWRLLDDVITDDVKVAFKRNPPEYVVSDDLSWLDNIILTVTGRNIDIKSLLAERLTREFRAFRAGHGTRTDDLGQFYGQGLRCLHADDAEAKARELFMTPEFGWVDEPKFLSAIEDIDARKMSGGREGRLYFCADEQSLITRYGGAGHYLVYGGEYLYCLGIRLVGASRTKETLKGIGRPTMFVCDIPMTIMREHTLREFSGMILEFLFCELIGQQPHALSPSAGSALSLTVDLPGEHIIGHYHPARVHDPLR
ncbi:hypothetical protein [Sphingomonas oryzagri]